MLQWSLSRERDNSEGGCLGVTLRLKAVTYKYGGCHVKDMTFRP